MCRPCLRSRGDASTAEALDQLPSIDAHRTCGCAQAIGGASVKRHEGELTLQAAEELGALITVFQSRHLAPYHNTLARSQRQLAAGALRFAEAALDALVDLRLHRRQL